MKYVRLSHNLTAEDPVPPGIEPLRVVRHGDTRRGDCSNIMQITMLTHVGTHVDAPRHFFADGLALTDFAVEEFVFTRPVCIDIARGDGELVRAEHLDVHSDLLAECDLLLVRTGFGKIRADDPERYATRSPGFSPSGARFLRDECPDLRALALDTVSLACSTAVEAGVEAHRILLGGPDRRFLIFEDVNLEPDLQALRRVSAFPLMIAQADGAPCTIVGELD